MNYRAHLLAAALLAAGAAAHAAPYAIRYTGTIAGSTITDVQDGQDYTVILIVDNGGTTAASQQWGREHLRCTIWRMNNLRNRLLRVDLGSHPPSTYSGSVTTAADGTLTGMFSSLVSSGLGAGQYISTFNFLPPALTWRIGGNGSQNGLYAGGGTANVTTFRDALHGAPSAHPGDWSAPQRLQGSDTDPCSDVLGPTVPRNPSATPGDARLDVSWQLPILVPGDTQARRYAAVASPYGGNPTHSCQVNHPATACSLPGLTSGTAYSVHVMAIDGGTILGRSESITATPFAPGAPGAPAGVTATPGDTRVALQWQPPTTGAAPTSYRVAAAPGNAGCTAQAPATTCTVPGLTNGTGYTFTVYAVNGVGESAAAGVGPIVPVAGQRGPGDATPVPALGLPALILLGAGAAGLGALRLRRRS